MTGPETPTSPDGTTESVDLYRAVVSLVAGGVGEGLERLRSVAENLETAEASSAPGAAGPFVTNPTAMAIVGFAAELPEQAGALADGAARVAYPLIRTAGVVVDTAAYLAQSTGLSSFVANVTLPTRRALVEEIERLAAVGSGEYARGRVLAQEVFTQSVDGIVSYLSDSDEVGELIREQTLGFAGGAVQEVRETGAAADGLTEGIFRRIFRRDLQELPPRPSFEDE